MSAAGLAAAISGGVDLLVATEDGLPDTRLGPGVTQLACTFEDYRLIQPASRYADTVTAAPGLGFAYELSQDPAFPAFVQEVFVDRTVIPLWTTDPTYTIDAPDLCISACTIGESPSAASALTTTSGVCGTPCVFNLTIIRPAADDNDTTEGGCNSETVRNATKWYDTFFDVDFRLVCWWPLIGPWAWHTGFENSIPTGYVADLLQSCKDYVNDPEYPERQNISDDPSEHVLCFVHTASRNGLADRPGKFFLVAEAPFFAPSDAPNMQVIMHELGHNFNAVHYPANDWRKFFCAGFEKQPNGDYHYQSYRSVMNYCHVRQGQKYFDSGNFATLDANLS